METEQLMAPDRMMKQKATMMIMKATTKIANRCLVVVLMATVVEIFKTMYASFSWRIGVALERDAGTPTNAWTAKMDKTTAKRYVNIT